MSWRPFIITGERRASENVYTRVSARFTEAEAQLLSIALLCAAGHDDAVAFQAAQNPDPRAAAFITHMQERRDSFTALHVRLLQLLVEGKET